MLCLIAAFEDNEKKELPRDGVPVELASFDSSLHLRLNDSTWGELLETSNKNQISNTV